MPIYDEFYRISNLFRLLPKWNIPIQEIVMFGIDIDFVEIFRFEAVSECGLMALGKIDSPSINIEAIK